MNKKILFFLKHPFKIPIYLLTKWVPYFRFLYHTSDYQSTVNFNFWFTQKVLNIGGNKAAYWPVHFTSKVYDVENIVVGIDAYPGIMGGCYIQGKGGILIGDHTQVGPNVVIVSANHDVYDSRKHVAATVKIGKYCWLGAGAKIMPGIQLGDWTIVAAGAVVTKSFEEGYCVIAGMPAVPIKQLDKSLCVPFQHQHDFNGYIRSEKFEAYRKKHLKI